ncbi:MAG: hypothetical protein ACRDUA_00670 [Micromonosporaceae bacterium]
MTAHELRFTDVPEVTVEFPGDTRKESASGSTRVNLPYGVTEGTTYRRVHVDYALASRIDPDLPDRGPADDR